MKVLFLAPQPFYGERGTPIAEDLILRTLSERGDEVDVLTYHIGQDVHHSGVAIHRIRYIPFIHQVAPGFSWQKLVCDLSMMFHIFPLIFKKRYDVVHAVEEAVFMGLLLKWLFGIPYVYDMDSALVGQMLEQRPRLFKPFRFLLFGIERVAVRNALAIVPVCDALMEDIVKYKPDKVVVLRDISLLGPTHHSDQEDLRAANGIQGTMIMYVGNLEPYQGIDLLLEGFSLASKQEDSSHLVIIGGKDSQISQYRAKVDAFGITGRVHFIGPRPIERLANYLSQADILVSPRISGNNTPMKIYSYLDSGKPLLATRLPTHTQVLDERVALLVENSPERFAEGLLQLVQDEGLRRRLGEHGKRLIQERHTLRIFREGLNQLYEWLKLEAAGQTGGLPGMPGAALESTELGHRFSLHYQPIIALDSGEIIGFEALLRQNDPNQEALSPTEFLSEAKKSGEILSLGRWVLKEACRQTRQWEQSFPDNLPLSISVNLSAAEFLQSDLIKEVDKVLDETGLEAQRLRLEVEETALTDGKEAAKIQASQLAERGIQLQIDYNGENPESLVLLNDLPATAVKLDPALLNDLNPETQKGILEHVVRVARQAGVDVIAVGVESAEQLSRVKELQCTYGQGYYFSKPMAGDSAKELLENEASRK